MRLGFCVYQEIITFEIDLPKRRGIRGVFSCFKQRTLKNTKEE